MKRNEFDGNMKELLQLLAKILKSYPGGSSLADSLQHQSQDKLNLNLCFFHFAPFSPEELETLEEALQSAAAEDDDETEKKTEDNFRWTASDLDFLRRNGMTF